MKYRIDGGSKIADIINNYPQTLPVFKNQGFSALTTDDGMRVLAPFLRLETLLRNRGIDQGAFIKLLNDAFEDEVLIDAPGLDSYESQKDLTMLALMPCGLKMPFSRVVTSFLEDYKKINSVDIKYAVEGNVNQELSYYSYIKTLKKVEELPDIVISADFNAFYGKKFNKEFVSPGHITGYTNCTPNNSFKKAGIVDPLDEYTVLGVNPLVIVASKNKTEGKELPFRWEDILDVRWKKNITLRGGNDFFCHAVLLPVYNNFGADGLKKLAANVCCGLHPAQMVKEIDSGTGSALYVMPEFFAHKVKKQQNIEIIWPEDGALASPVTLQVKRSKIDELKPVLDYLTGEELAGTLNSARFPVPHKGVKGEIQDKPLLWPGWDFFRKRDLLEVNDEIDRIFMPLVRDIIK